MTYPPLFAIATAAIMLLPLSASADGGCEFIPAAKPVKMLPGSVPASDDQPPPRRERLSKQRLPDIRNSYARLLAPGDSFQEKTSPETRTLILFQRQAACGTTRDVPALKISERTADNPNVSKAFTALKAMTLLGQHSEAEYQQTLSRHGSALKAYFRTVPAPDGQLIDEGRLILDRCRKEEAGQRGTLAPATSADNKQQARELRARMQEMKARGDLAGMMQAAQQFQNEGRGNAAASQGKQEMNRDLWPLWLQCVQDLHAAAYLTRLEYSADPD